MFHHIPNEWTFSRNRSCAPMFLSVFFARLFQASIKATAMISLICFFLCVPHTLMAIGLAIAVIHSITRVPVFHLIAGRLSLSNNQMRFHGKTSHKQEILEAYVSNELML